MYIHIDHNSGEPISQQIVEQIKYLAISGALKGNEKIPSVRGLASELKLNPTTVARVYRQLESEGIIFTQRGKGTFIALRGSGLTKKEKQRRIQDGIRKLVVEAGRLDVDSRDLLQMISQEIDALYGAIDDTSQEPKRRR
ncbi:MAG: GntR family transcriptional regulator [Candidatus Hydrogenedentota bacterium]